MSRDDLLEANAAGLASQTADPELLAFLKKEIRSDIESEIKIQAKKIKAEILAEITKSKSMWTLSGSS